MQRIILLFSLIFLFSSTSFGQKKEFDTKYKLLLELAWSNLDSSKILLKSLYPTKEKIKKAEYNAYYFNAEGVILYVEENYPAAHKKYQKAYLEAKKWGDHRFMGIMLNNISACFVDEKNAAKKIEYLEEAKQEFIIAKDDEWLMNVEYNLGVAYYYNSQYQKALKSYQLTEKYFFDLKDSVSASYAISGQGSVYLEQRNYPKAIEKLKLSMELLDRESDPETYSNVLNNIGQAQLALKQYPEAKKNLYEALKISQEIESVLEQTRSYELLREYFKSEKNLDSALHYSELASTFGDSLKWSNYNNKFAEEETRFNTQLKTEKIALQKENIAQQEASIRKLTILSFALGVLLLAIILLWFRLNRRKLQLEIANNDKEVLLREIHHRVKNNMQVVSSLLNMHVRKVKDEDSKKILEDGSERIQAMALIQKNLYPHSDLKSISLNEYLHNLSHQLFDNYNIYNKEVMLKTSFDEIKVDVDKLIPIGLIVNEILCNAVKHAFNDNEKGEVIIKLIDANENIQLEMSDSGNQFPDNWEEDSNPSLGLKFIRIFSHKLQAKLTIQRIPNTLITLNFPKA